MLPVLGVIGAGAAKGVVAKKITSGVKSKITKVSKDKLLGRGGSSTSMSSAAPTHLLQHQNLPSVHQLLLVEIHFSQSINH